MSLVQQIQMRLKSGALGLVIINMSGMGLSLVASVILARWLGVAGFGIYAQIFALASMAAVVAGFGLPVHLWRSLSQAIEGKVQHIYAQHLLTQVCLIVVVGLGLVLIAPLFQGAGAFAALELVLLLFVLQGLVRLAEMSLNAYDKTKLAAFLMKICLPLVQLGCLGLALWLSLDAVSWVLCGIAFWYLMILVFDLGRMKLVSFSSVAAIPIIDLIKPRALVGLLRSASAYFVVSSVLAINTNIDLILLGLMINDEEAGLYRVALSFYSIMNIVTISIGTAMGPRISQAINADALLAFQGQIRKSCRLAALILAFVGAGIFIFGASFVGWVYGLAFAGSIAPMLILASGAFLVGLAGPIGNFVVLLPLKRELALSSLVLLGANISANLLLIPMMGSSGAATATAGSALVWTLWLVFLVKRRTGVLCLV